MKKNNRSIFRKKEKSLTKYPFMEYSTPRRVSATPMGEASADNFSIQNAFPIEHKEGVDHVSREGFWVKDGFGVAMNEYWVPKEVFEPSHIRTNMFTIGELPIMLLNGNILKREFWPNNQFIMYRGSVDLDIDLKQTEVTKEVPAFAKMEGFISKVTIHSDPLKKDKFDIHLEPWQPSQDDIFAKDFQTVKIDFSNLGSKKK